MPIGDIMKLNLTLAKLYDLAGPNGRLRSLHGTPKPVIDEKGAIVRNPDGSLLVDVIPLKLGAGVRLNVALMLIKFEPLIKAFEEIKASLIKEAKKAAKDAAPAGATEEQYWVPTAPSLLAAQDALNALTLETREVEIDHRIKLSDLKPDENNLDPSLIIALQDVVDLSA